MSDHPIAPASKSTRRPVQPSFAAGPPAVIALVSISALWTVLWLVHSWGYWEDDSFIHLEFARSLASGRGFAFNGAVVYGDTAPLWVLLLAAVHLLIPDWLIAGKILAVIATTFTLTGAYLFSRRLSSTHSGSEVFSAAMVLLLVLNPYFCYWVFSGMETIAAAGLALWTVIAATSRPLGWSRFLLGCALAGLAPLLRPELIFFTAILAPLLLYRRFADRVAEPPFAKIAGLAAGAALLAGPTLAWARYALHTFGRIIPNTNAAKRAGPGESVPMRLLNVYSLGYPVILAGLLAALTYFFLNASNLKQRFESARRSTVYTSGGWIFVLWTAITLGFYIVNHTHVQTRYVVVSAVGLTIVVFAATLAVSARACRNLFGASLLMAAVITLSSLWPFIRNKNIFVAIVREQAGFIHTQLPAAALVADYNIGEIAFFSEHPILDTGGITRPSAIPFLNRPFDDLVQWVHSQGGEYWVYETQPEPGAVLVLSQPFPYVGWSLDPRHYSRTQLLNLWKLAPNDLPPHPLAAPETVTPPKLPRRPVHP